MSELTERTIGMAKKKTAKALKSSSRSSLQKMPRMKTKRMSSKKNPSSVARSFEQRKVDHIQFALDERTQVKTSDLEKIRLKINALPDLNFSEVSTETIFLNQKISSPIFISSMTAGHALGSQINLAFAELSSEKQILFAVGSQRRELSDKTAHREWKEIRQKFPRSLRLGNLGISQLITHGVDSVLKLIDDLECLGFYIHWNALQEVLQPEGTPNFRGGLRLVEELVRQAPVPILVKEVGCGMSVSNVQQLSDIGVYAVDLAGFGGTHWGRVEGLRSPQDSLLGHVAETFANWGMSSTETLLLSQKENVSCQLWASGGIRSGLDAAKMISMGASMVGVAQPFMKAFVAGGMFNNKTLDKQTKKVELKTHALESLDEVFERFNYELRTALFCTGSEKIYDLRGRFDKLERI